MKPPLHAVIEEVITEPSKVQPIIVNFQNGELKDKEAKKMSCGLFYDQKKRKTLLALSNGQIVYRGYKPDTSQDLMRTMLVFHNRKTGKVRMVEAERWQVSPILDKPVIENNQGNENDKIAALNKQFGSKKVKRRTEQYEKLKVNVDNVKERLEQTVSNVEIDRTDLLLQESENDYIANTNLPGCNRNAATVKDVYKIEDIIPESKLETLYDTANKMLSNDESFKGKDFFVKTLKYVKSDPDNVKKIALLLYIQAVVTWLNMPMKDAKKRGIVVCSFSEEVNSYVMEMYSVQSNHGRLRPNTVKDKGVVHCMILALVVRNFALDLEQFAQIFNHRMGLKKLTDLARIIGALPNKDDKKTVTLKLPLPPPLSMLKRGKKRQQ